MLAAPSASDRSHEDPAVVSERSPSTASSAVLAYVDTLESTQTLVPHARAIAKALNAPLTLLHVLELPVRSDGPADPLEWSLWRQEAHDRIKRIAGEGAARQPKLDIKIAEGRPVDQICRYLRELQAVAVVVGTNADENAAGYALGDTARKLIDRCRSSLLLIPPVIAQASAVHYQRILVPLDGSRNAESVLPLAMRLAKAADSELILAHIIPAPELTETGPLEADDHRLRQQVSERNERVAKKYLDQVRSRLACSGFAVRSVVLRDGDVRSSLLQLLDDEPVDLLVMSAHGHGNRPDVACGSVADYMTSHVRIPLLLVTGAQAPGGEHRASNRGQAGQSRGFVS